MEITLKRLSTGDHGTFGVLQNFVTAELPWKDNHPALSCIPSGTYAVSWTQSAKTRADGSLEWPDGTYELLNVPDRSGIRIHSGNFCGDVSLGWQSDVEGCILIGYKQASMINKYGKFQDGISDSRVSLASFEESLNKQPFTLVIQDVTNAGESAA